MIDKNLILYLPFDDPDGSVAYDFSQSRANGTISDGAYLSKDSKTGKALALNGAGECETTKAISFSSDFTLCFFVMPTTKELGWLLNLPGVNKFLEQWIAVKPKEWIFMAFVKQGTLFTVYHNYSQIYTTVLTGTPTGLSINDQNLSGSFALLDEVMLYNVAKSPKEIYLLQKDTDVEYYVDGKNFKDYGVSVSQSTGLVGRLERKEALTVEWDNYHGVVRDKKRPRFKERTITLECFIEASSRSAFVEWAQMFLAQFDGEGNHRLTVEYDGKAKPLVYEVELLDDVDIDKKWGTYNKELMVGTFKLKLTEDEPVKRVLRHIGSTANSEVSITTTSSKLLNIYWGDGSHTYDVSGTDRTITHTYDAIGEYDIIITGVIEDITDFSTNAIVIWDVLK